MICIAIPDRPVQSDTVLGFSGKHPSHAAMIREYNKGPTPHFTDFNFLHKLYTSYRRLSGCILKRPNFTVQLLIMQGLHRR